MLCRASSKPVHNMSCEKLLWYLCSYMVQSCSNVHICSLFYTSLLVWSWRHSLLTKSYTWYIHNQLGSFRCDCNKGFTNESSEEPPVCVDINECVEDNPCDQYTQLCYNGEGWGSHNHSATLLSSCTPARHKKNRGIWCAIVLSCIA
jgi:hypothetical protein